MFKHQFGDYVVVPGHGVGQVLTVEEKIEGSSEKVTTYVEVKLLSSGIKVKVPERQGTSVLRSLVSAEEVSGVYEFLKNHENIKFNKQTWNRRYRDYMAKINTGSLKEIAEVLREMLLIRATKKLSYSEKRVLDLCREMLVQEIALSLGSREQEISGSIDAIFNVNV